MSTTTITRHFASITTGRWGARQVHYRRAGSGPVVILFHQSPLSSVDMIATMRRWADHFTCIAPDSPGFGLSDAMGVKHAEMRDFADAALEFMDALGIDRAAVYGFHTGAMISGAIAAAYPARIVCAAGNGYVMMAEGEKLDIVENYLPAFVPAWDGSHLTWLWARMREQTIFFPWYAKSLAARLRGNVPPAATLHAGLLDFMRSGDHYRVGYRAAFLMRSDLALRDMRVPMLVTAYDTDVLATHLPRIRHASDSVTVQAGGTVEQTLDLCRDYIKRHKPPKGPKISPPAALRGRLHQDYVTLESGQLRLRRNDEGQGRTALILHDALGSTDTVVTIAAGFIGRRPVVALELPGHGESDDLLKAGKPSIVAYAKIIDAALEELDLSDVDVIGLGAGAVIGLELALLNRARVHALAMVGVAHIDPDRLPELLEKIAPPIEPDWFGGHLLQAWYVVRDHALFWPWYERTSGGVVLQEPQVEPARLQQRVLELFRSRGNWGRTLHAQFAYPLHAKLTRACGRAALPIVFAASDLDPQRDQTWRVAASVPQAARQQLPDAESKWATTLLAYFDGIR
jgi:pimeloyl-ACP methyl ester carboxylesterase